MDETEAERNRLAQQWRDRLFKATADELEILEAQMQAELEFAEKHQLDITDIVAYYEHKRKELSTAGKRRRMLKRGNEKNRLRQKPGRSPNKPSSLPRNVLNSKSRGIGNSSNSLATASLSLNMKKNRFLLKPKNLVQIGLLSRSITTR